MILLGCAVGCAPGTPAPREPDAGPRRDAGFVTPDATGGRDAAGLDGGARTDAPACTPVDDEPNDDEESAARIDVTPPWGCSNRVDLRGNLGAGDVDVYRIQGADTTSPTCDAARVAVTGLTGVAACIFVQCAIMDGDAPDEIVCMAGTAAVSDKGRPGCCGTDAAAMHTACDTGSTTAVSYYVQLSGSSSCEPYDLRFDYR